MKRSRTSRLAAAAAAVAAACLAHPRAAAALPDITPQVSDLEVVVRDVTAADVEEGCAGGQFGRRLVSFSLRTLNLGPDDLVLGNPGCPNCSLDPGAECTNPLFVCGTSHGHAHFEQFAENVILDSDDNVVAAGRKYGFCLLDTGCPTPQYSCSYQGITAGCGDIYSAGLPCQYIDITDDNLPDGVYTLRVRLDPDDVFAEEDDSNNVIEVPFEIGSTDQVCPAYDAAGLPLAIPDNDTMTAVLPVPDLGEITSVRLRMSGTHTFLGDLSATLTSPEATTRTLFSRICGNDDDFGLYLGDDAVGPLVCPATDASVLRTPAESFTPFIGEQAQGNWTLTVTDHAPNDEGDLEQWSLEVCSLCGNGVLDPGELCDDGNPFDGDCCDSTCQVALGDGADCDDGNACTTSETCSAGQCVPGGALECDPCLVCDSADGCVVPDLIYPCQEAPTRGSVLKLNRDSADPTRDKLVWRWRSQTPVELDEFGAPDLVTDISFCLYDAGELLMSSTIPAASECDGRPCWVRRSHSARFKDRQAAFGGLSRIGIREGSKGRIVLKGLGPGLGLGFGDVDLTLPATARLRRGDGTPCWEASFEEAATSSPEKFKARSR